MNWMIVVAFASFAFGQDMDDKEVDLKQNLETKIAHEQWPGVTLGQTESKEVELASGAEFLMQQCKENPERWARDGWFYRLAHANPFSIASCREKSSPSLHLITRQKADGSYSGKLHLDGHGATNTQSRLVHLGEFLLHKAQGRDNNQETMAENLRKSFNRLPTTQQTVELTFRDRAATYLFQTFGPTALTSATTTAAMGHAWYHFSSPVATHREAFQNRFAGIVTRRAIRGGIEMSVASALHEDTRFIPSGQKGFKKRVGYAFRRSMFVPAPGGDEFAFSRFAATCGTAVLVNQWHPWREQAPSLLRPMTLGFSTYIMRSFVTEFKPDVFQAVRKLMHK